MGIISSNAANRPFVPLKVQSLEGKWLYDTGASVTCMSLKHFRQIHPDNRPPKLQSHLKLISAAKTVLKVTGMFMLKFKIFDKVFSHPVHVCETMNQQGIIGMDIIKRLGLTYLPNSKSFIFESHLAIDNSKTFNASTVFKHSSGVIASLVTDRKVIIPPHTQKTLQFNCIATTKDKTAAGVTAVANIFNSKEPLLWGGPALIQTNFKSKTHFPVTNCGPTAVTLERGTILGQMESIVEGAACKVDEQQLLHAVNAVTVNRPPPPSPERQKQILADLTLTVPDCERQKYIDLIMANHDVFSKTKNDLGRANNFTHKIDLKDKAPVYIPQYRLPDTHKVKLEEQVDEWLKMGIIQPSNSRYNSPIFVVPKKNGENRYVLDYRAVNAHSHDDRYTMRTVDECIAEIGKSKSSIFSTMDLSSGYHQMLLDKNSRQATAFTVPGKGQYEWLTTSMGLRGAVSSFQRMVELAMKDIQNLIVYIDDLLAHSSNHEDHRAILQLVFDRLRTTGLKANLKKCHFGSPTVAYLGFQLTPEGVLPGKDKLAAVRNSEPPTSVHQVRQFLGLVNFFRTHVRNFSMIASPLTQLTRKDTPWRGGQLPPDALFAFNELKQILCSEPIVAYPRADRPFSLIVDAAAGITKVNSKGERTFKQEGGLGAILCQPDEKGELHVIAYASRALSEHEKNYSPFLLEMLACCWGIEHFDVHLRGRKFVIYSDHRPLEKLSCVHKKTLSRLEQKMTEYDFIIQYKKGSEMPADFLSRNVLAEIDVFTPDLPILQQRDEFAHSVIEFLQKGSLPADRRKAAYVARTAPSCFLEDGILWRRIVRYDAPARTVLVLPAALVDQLVHETHTSTLTGHEGISKTKERLLQSYFWPNMDADIARHTEACQRCQARRKDIKPVHNLLSPLPQCTALNQRCHMDLFGPLKTSNEGKKFVLCITDAFTKYAEMVAIDNKEAGTVAKHVFERWICRFGTPLEIVTDNGREFCNALSKELYKLLQIKHTTTSPYWPQCNSQAEVANKTIQKYLASFVDETTLDWPLYMAPMAFAYNTSLHRSIKSTPYFLTFGQEPRYPSFPNPDLQRYYGESDAAQWYQQLQHCRQVAAQHNMDASARAEMDYNKTARPHHFAPGQAVWLNEQNFLGRNRKLSPNWLGPYPILKVFDNGVVELQLPRRKLRVNVGRIKPYVAPVRMQHRFIDLPAAGDPGEAAAPQQPQADPAPREPPATAPPATTEEDDNAFWEDNDRYWPTPTPHLAAPAPVPQVPQQPSTPPAPAAPPPPKRGRGRPPKIRLATTTPPADGGSVPTQQPALLHAQDAPQQQQQQTQPPERMITRAMARAAARQQLTPEEAVSLQKKVHQATTQLWHTGGTDGPQPVLDEFGLPKYTSSQPKAILKRRKFLQSLAPTTRNLLLTGDPVFAFDPLVYATVLHVPQQLQPPILQQQFDYLQNNTTSPEPTAQSSCSSSQPSPTPSPPPSTPPATPSAPHRPRRHPDDNAGGASQSSGYYFLRSSPESVNPLHSLHEQLHGSWKTLQRKSSQIAADLLQVPPPGWKPPKDPRAPPKPPTALQRAARAAKRELLHPPPPWFEQDDPGTSKGRGGGKRK